jgi:hypothetical protein
MEEEAALIVNISMWVGICALRTRVQTQVLTLPLQADVQSLSDTK